jgi:hypothetical protein
MLKKEVIELISPAFVLLFKELEIWKYSMPHQICFTSSPSFNMLICLLVHSNLCYTLHITDEYLDHLLFSRKWFTNLSHLYMIFQEAHKRSNNWLPPPWAIVALLVLGFNEFMTLLRYMYSEIWFCWASCGYLDVQWLTYSFSWQKSFVFVCNLCWFSTRQSLMGAAGHFGRISQRCCEYQIILWLFKPHFIVNWWLIQGRLIFKKLWSWLIVFEKVRRKLNLLLKF